VKTRNLTQRTLATVQYRNRR